ncbi:hypothetical protein REB14_17655 [Chryseobacterium sp. ES2]|uniref:Uncharacterized protein n=1 Tax=Chryseobacterium metallicongregator TaxID=3073042 RepID=A0ABU1E856_9FLAO|nr:hypothetical protein [Chryseobacterium sp. ES2]MDR4954009.1 hypothetical protein [Chryseobacterium sp. ES2]
MEWKNFSLETKKTPIEVVDETLQGFNKATGGLLNLSLFEKSNVEKMRNQDPYSFQYDLILHSKFMKSYKFDVFELSFDATLYPCSLLLERGITEELKERFYEPMVLDTESKLRIILEKVFTTKRFEEIVEGLMKISSLSKKNEEDSLPF